MGYQTVRALVPIRHSGVLRIPGQTSGDNAQDFVAEDSQVARLVALGFVTSLGAAAAPADPTPGGPAAVSVAVQDEGAQVSAGAAVINFRGAGVTASAGPGGAVNVDIPGGAGSLAVQHNGAQALASASAINMVPGPGHRFDVSAVGSVARIVSSRLSENPTSYEYSNGTVRARGRNPADRATAYPSTLHNVTATLPTGNATNLTIAADSTMLLRDNQVVSVTNVTTAYAPVSFTTSFAVPASGLFYVPVYMPDYEAGGYNPTIEINVTCSDSTAVKYTFAATGLRAGAWNYLPIWDNTTALDSAFQKSGVSYTAAAGAIAGKTVTGFNIVRYNMPAGSVWYVGNVTTGKRVRPAIVFTNDVTNNSSFTYFQAALESRGMRGAFRIGGFSESGFTDQGRINFLRAAYNNGHDVYNGSWSRTALNASTTELVFAREVLACHNRAVELGFTRGMTWFSSSGNSLPSQAMCRSFGPKVGYRVFKAPNGIGVINTMQGGTDENLYATPCGSTTLSALTAAYNGLKIAGGSMIHFSHEFVAASPTGTATLQSDFDAFLDLLKADMDAGLVDVLTPSQFDSIYAV